MRKFFFGFLIGIVFVGAGLAAVGVWAAFAANRKPYVPDKSALVLNLEGSLPEQAPIDVSIPFVQQQESLTVAETWNLLHRAATDYRVKALVLEPRDLSVGWAKLEELRDDILAFKKSGKPVYAYLRGAGTREYYVASAADRVL